MDIAHELERSRLLGTTRPTDEEILEAFGVVRDELHEAENRECENCKDTRNAADNLIGVAADGAEGALLGLLVHCGFSGITAKNVAERFIDTIKASVKAA